MFDQETGDSFPEHFDGAAKSPDRPALSAEEIEAQTVTARHDKEALDSAEQLAENSDREQVINQHVINNEMFGYEPYGDETLGNITNILLQQELEERGRRGPDFNITQWSNRRILRLIDRKYTHSEKRISTVDREETDKKYSQAKAEILESEPNISNTDLCKRLLENPENVPETELNRLRAFVQIQELAANEADAAVITERINTLDFSREIPDPVVFLQTQIFSTPENDTGISEETQEALKTAFGIRPMRDASDLLDTLDQIQDNENRFVNTDGKVRSFNKNEGIPLSEDVSIFTDPTNPKGYLAKATVSGRELTLAFDRNVEPQFLDEQISTLMIGEVFANRDFQAAAQYIFGGDGLASQGMGRIKLDEFQVARGKQMYGAFMGFGVEARTGFPNQSDLREFERRLQATHIDGDAKTGDNTDRGDLSWQEIGMLRPNNQINMQKVEAVGAYINRAPTSLPTYHALVAELGGNDTP